MQAVIMAAGKSTRTYPVTLTRPKPLIPILNRPLIYFNLDQLVDIVNEVILIVGYRKEMIEELLSREYRGLKLIYQEQKEQLGTGHAVLQAAPHVRDRFIVMNGDDLFAREDLEKLKAYRYATVAMPVEDPSQYGIIETDEQGYLVDFIEKPNTNISNLANVGCYVFEPDVFSILEQMKPSERGEIELPAAMLEIKEREPVQVVSLTGYWFPTGFPWDLLKTQRYFLNHVETKFGIMGMVEEGAMLHGNVYLGEGSVVRSGAQIFGPVYIGNGCEIGSLSYIGSNTCLGHHSHIDAHCVIENSLVMDNCQIETGCIIRHSIIGSNVYIGEGCHLISQLPDRKSIQSKVKNKWLNTHLSQLGATLGDNVRLGAKTGIAPGCKIWPGMQTAIGTIVEDDILEN